MICVKHGIVCLLAPKNGNSESCKVAGFKTQPATRNFFRLSLGVRRRVCVPYIYKIKIKKKNIPIGLRFQREGNIGKYSETQLRVAGCKLRYSQHIAMMMLDKMEEVY